MNQWWMLIVSFKAIDGFFCFIQYYLSLKIKYDCLAKPEILVSFRVDPKETIYTGVCPSESDTEEATNQESYCFCDQSSDCGPGNDVTSCPFELDG